MFLIILVITPAILAEKKKQMLNFCSLTFESHLTPRMTRMQLELNQTHLTTDHNEFGNKRVNCHAIKGAETTLTIKLQRPNPNEEEVGG